jgi:acyl-CoA thioesterase-1
MDNDIIKAGQINAEFDALNNDLLLRADLNDSALLRVYERGFTNAGNTFRIKRVMDKAMSGESITVGFIGGSITQGSLSSTPESCYAYLVYKWWRDRFPKAHVRYINAGVGATTSQYGAARVERDLLCYDPDIVFAEFSVNDRNEDFFQETYEGLIRRILLFRKEPALFLLNNVFYDNGRNTQELHNEVGRYYDLPIVSMRESIYKEIENGSINREDITPDSLHPNDAGHKLIAGLIINRLEDICNERLDKPQVKAGYEAPLKPLTQNRYANAGILNNKTCIPLLTGFKADMTKKAGSWDVFRDGWSGLREGDKISIDAEGSFISVQYRKYAQHPAPVAELVIDEDIGNPIILDANFDETWGDCLYLQDILTGGEARVHNITITITKAVEGKEFYLASVIKA